MKLSMGEDHVIIDLIHPVDIDRFCDLACFDLRVGTQNQMLGWNTIDRSRGMRQLVDDNLKDVEVNI